MCVVGQSTHVVLQGRWDERCLDETAAHDGAFITAFCYEWRLPGGLGQSMGAEGKYEMPLLIPQVSEFFSFLSGAWPQCRLARDVVTLHKTLLQIFLLRSVCITELR